MLAYILLRLPDGAILIFLDAINVRIDLQLVKYLLINIVKVCATFPFLH